LTAAEDLQGLEVTGERDRARPARVLGGLALLLALGGDNARRRREARELLLRPLRRVGGRLGAGAH
jgi:hypothetical protein